MKLQSKIIYGALAGLALLFTNVCQAYEESVSLFSKEYLQTASKKERDFMATQGKDSAAFFDSLKTLSPEKRWEKLKTMFQSDKLLQPEKTFRHDMFTDKMTELKQQLATNNQLTDSQKNELLAFYSQQYNEDETFLEKAHTDLLAYVTKLDNDSSLNFEQKEQALKDFGQKNKPAMEAYYTKKKAAEQAELDRISKEMVLNKVNTIKQ